MIIDAHTHLGKKTIVATANQLVASMDAAGIDLSLVFAGKLNGLANPQLFADVATHKDRLLAIGSITPLSPDRPSVETVESWLAHGLIRGLKFYPGYEPFYPYDKCVRPYLELLAQHGRPAIFHSGDTFSAVHSAKLKYAQPIHIDDIAVDLPELQIVIAHFGYPWQIDAAEVVYKNRNVWVDCSGFVYGKFNPTAETHFRQVVAQYVQVAGGKDRILFGTDWPISDQSSYLDVMRRIFADDPAIFSDNAKKLFGIG